MKSTALVLLTALPFSAASLLAGNFSVSIEERRTSGLLRQCGVSLEPHWQGAPAIGRNVALHPLAEREAIYSWPMHPETEP